MDPTFPTVKTGTELGTVANLSYELSRLVRRTNVLYRCLAANNDALLLPMAARAAVAIDAAWLALLDIEKAIEDRSRSLN